MALQLAASNMSPGGPSGGQSSTLDEHGVSVTDKRFGAKGDGVTNDAPAVLLALNFVVAAGGGILFFPKGTYNLSTWTPPTLTVPFTIVGTELTTIVGVRSTDTAKSFVKIVNTSFSIENISLDGFYDVLDFTNITTIVPSIKVNNVRFTNYARAAIRWPETTTNKTGGVDRMVISNNEFRGGSVIPKYGMDLETPIFRHIDIIGNTIDNIRERGIYVGSTTLALQDLRENINIERNNVGNIYNPYGDGSVAGDTDWNTTAGEGKRAANGIQIMATNAVISHNYLYEINNWCKQDNEGIYTKCKYAIIEKNHLVNAGGSEAMIDIKGNGRVNSPLATCSAQTSATVLNVTNAIYGLTLGASIDIFDSLDTLKVSSLKVVALNLNLLTGTGTITVNLPTTTLATDYIAKTGRSKGYGVICVGNTLVDNRPTDLTPVPGGTDPFATTGIKINNQDVRVEQNLIEGMTFNAVYIGGSDYRNIDIKNNKIRKIRGWGGISVGGIGVNFSVTGNQIVEINSEIPTANTPYAITVAGSVQNIMVKDNQIDTVLTGQSTATPGGVVVAPATLQSVGNLTIAGNQISNTVRALYFKSNPADDVWVHGNKFKNCTSNVTYSVNPSNILVGVNNPTIASPPPIDPSTLVGMYAWFDAATIAVDSPGITDGTVVTSWRDKSPNAKNLRQEVTAMQPFFSAGSLNNLPAMRFSGAQNMRMTIPSPTSAPTLGQSVKGGATIAAGTWYCAYSWKNAIGETLVSPVASIVLTAGNQIDMTIPALPAGVTSACIYIGTAANALFVQVTSLTLTTFSRSTPPLTATANKTENLAGSPWAAQMTKPNTIFVVAQMSDGYVFEGLLTNGSDRQYLRASSGAYQMSGGKSLALATVTADTKYHMFVLSYADIGLNSTIKMDTLSTTGDAASPTSSSLSGMVLGSTAASALFATAKICEIIVYNNALSGYDQSQVEYYLKSKYGI